MATAVISQSLQYTFQAAVEATKIVAQGAFDIVKHNPILTAAVVDFGFFGGAGTTMLAQELAGAASGLLVETSAHVAEVAKDAASGAIEAATNTIGITPDLAGQTIVEAATHTPLGMMVHGAMELQSMLGLRP
jgi:hypothetical protein